MVGRIISGAYGCTVGSAMGMGCIRSANGVDATWIASGKFEIMVEGKLIPAKASLRSPYNHKNERTKM